VGSRLTQYHRRMPDRDLPESRIHPSDGDAERRKWVRGHPIPGHLADVRAWMTPDGRRQEQAVCECGWKGAVRSEFAAGNRDADEHLIAAFVIRRPRRRGEDVASHGSVPEPQCGVCGLSMRFGPLIAGADAYICLKCVEELAKVVREIREEESSEEFSSRS
jgi:hypothetical protein